MTSLVSSLFISTDSQLLFFLYNVLLSFQKGNSFGYMLPPTLQILYEEHIERLTSKIAWLTYGIYIEIIIIAK